MTRVKSQERRVKSRAGIPRSGSGLSPRRIFDSTLDSERSARRRGFTLVELLIVITILAILATLVVGVAAIAGQTGREAKTRNMVARLHTLLMEHYNGFKTRRVEVNPAVVNAINGSATLTPRQKQQALVAARLYAHREMMLMEVPDRWSDVLLNAVPVTPTGTPPGISDARPLPLYLAERPALVQTYLRRYVGLRSRTNTISGSVNTGDDIKRFQGAECLYMVVMLACGDGEARSLFNESDIGDVDGDGAPEFVDAWGHPIDFLRWAPGFDSQIQLNANLLGSPAPQNPMQNPLWESEATRDHDPFDLFRVELAAFRLVPLIYSPGRDERYGIVVGAKPSVDPDYIPWPRPPVVLVISGGPPYLSPPLTPYFFDNPPLDNYLGTDIGEGTATDNLHNHLIGGRL